MDGKGVLRSVSACPCLWGPYREVLYLQGGGSEQRGDYYFLPRALRRAARGPTKDKRGKRINHRNGLKWEGYGHQGERLGGPGRPSGRL